MIYFRCFFISSAEPSLAAIFVIVENNSLIKCWFLKAASQCRFLNVNFHDFLFAFAICFLVHLHHCNCPLLNCNWSIWSYKLIRVSKLTTILISKLRCHLRCFLAAEFYRFVLHFDTKWITVPTVHFDDTNLWLVKRNNMAVFIYISCW